MNDTHKVMTALVPVLLVLVTFNTVLLVLVTDRMFTFKVLFWSFSAIS